MSGNRDTHTTRSSRWAGLIFSVWSQYATRRPLLISYHGSERGEVIFIASPVRRRQHSVVRDNRNGPFIRQFWHEWSNPDNPNP